MEFHRVQQTRMCPRCEDAELEVTDGKPCFCPSCDSPFEVTVFFQIDEVPPRGPGA